MSTKDLKEKLNISQNSKIVLGVGYGDKRKGIDLFIDINYRSLDIDTNGDSFFNSRIQFPYVRSLILRINKESNIMTVHLMRDIDLFSAFANFEVNYDNCIINIKNDFEKVKIFKS